MKTLRLVFPPLLLILCLSVTGRAQEQIVIPISNPDKPGTLNIGIARGSITVSGYNGKEVLIRYSDNDGQDEQKKPANKNGLRRISGSGIGFEATENNNTVEVGGVSPMHHISFEISVPREFSLNISTVDGEAIKVENISGEMELSNVNGEIILNNVEGSAVANTVNGDIKATFDSVNPDKPMAFSNLNGNIDITLPASTEFIAKMKSEWGDVFTDFDMDINSANQNKVNTSADSDTYRVSVNNWINGAVNGGGPEFSFKSMRGDIYIRKR